MGKDYCRPMLTVNGIDCKRYIEIIGSDKDTRNYEIIQEWLHTAVCPNSGCHAIGQFNNHGYYSRGIIDLLVDGIQADEILVLRGYCKSCGTSHAFLPEDSIPYKLFLLVSFLINIFTFFVKLPETDNEIQIPTPILEAMGHMDEDYKGDANANEYHYHGPCCNRMRFKNLKLYEHFLWYIQDVIRSLELWDKERQPESWEVIRIVLAGDIQLIQRRTLELHHIPMFFRRKRTKDGIPHTGMLKTG